MIKKWLFIFIFLALLINLPFIFSGNFTFSLSSAADLFYLKNIWELKKVYFIAPWSANSAFFQGPLYYYLSLPFFILAGGRPATLAFVSCLSLLATLTAGFAFFAKKSQLKSLFFAVFVLSSPLFGSLSLESGPITFIPFLTLLFSFTLYQILHGKELFVYWAFLLAGLSFHFQPLAGLNFILFLILFFLFLKRVALKKLILGLFIFSLTFLPTVIFDLRHHFLQSQALFDLIRDKTPLEPLRWRFFEQILVFFKLWGQTLASFDLFAWLFFFVVFYWLLLRPEKQNKSQILFDKTLLCFLLVNFLTPLFFFPLKNQGVNLYPSVMIFLLLSTKAYTWFWQEKKLLRIGSIFFLLLNFLINLNLKQKQTFLFHGSETAHFLSSQKNTLDALYQDAGGQSFKVYFYTPPIYDYTWQYLIFSYTYPKYRQLPADFAYLPDKPVYLEGKNLHLQHLNFQALTTNLIYLVLEPDTDEHHQAWLNNFSSLSLEKKISLANGITMQKMIQKQ